MAKKKAVSALDQLIEDLVELFDQSIAHLPPKEQEERIAWLEAHLGAAKKT